MSLCSDSIDELKAGHSFVCNTWDRHASCPRCRPVSVSTCSLYRYVLQENFPSSTDIIGDTSDSTSSALSRKLGEFV